jgi:hypothetical protein
MKNFVGQIAEAKDLRINIALIFAIFTLVVLGCMGGSKTSTTPVPSSYYGDWKGSDGSTLTIRSDNSGDFRSGSFKVENGTVAVDDAKKEISVTFFGIGKTLKIDQEPSGNQMKLGGVSYSKDGGTITTAPNSSNTSTTSNTSTSTNSTSTSTNPFGSGSNDADSKNTPKPTASGDVPPDSELQSLVQETIQSFGDAVESEDFTDFRDDSSKVFQKQYTADACKTAFQVFINAKDRVIPTIRSSAAMTPSYSPAPNVTSQAGYKILNANGSYDTSSPMNFELQYVKEGAEWKMVKIRVIMK